MTGPGDLRLSRDPDSWSFYTLSYSIDGLAAMFEATGNAGRLGAA